MRETKTEWAWLSLIYRSKGTQMIKSKVKVSEKPRLFQKHSIVCIDVHLGAYQQWNIWLYVSKTSRNVAASFIAILTSTCTHFFWPTNHQNQCLFACSLSLWLLLTLSWRCVIMSRWLLMLFSSLCSSEVPHPGWLGALITFTPSIRSLKDATMSPLFSWCCGNTHTHTEKEKQWDMF